MSFSSDAKSELCKVKNDRACCALAECYGILLFCNTFSSSEIRIITASPDFADILPRLFKKAFGEVFDVLPREDCSGKRTFLINDSGKISAIFNRFGLDSDSALMHHVNLAVLEEDCCKISFIRGAFLAGGSVTDPDKHFHLELATSHKAVIRETYSILLDMGFSPRTAERKLNSLLYFKQADMIADFFTCIGASATAINIITAKVDREMRNTITRRVNCDSANADKVVNAAQEQIDAIHRYASRFGLDSLPDALKSTAYLRVANPEASLSDLSLLSSPPVSKSCLSYRLKKIMELADSDGQ